MMPTILSLFAAAALPAVAYSIPLTPPKEFVADASCTSPESFVIEQFEVWTPAAGNNRSTIINFGYWDNSTDIQTVCHFNGTSKNVAGPGLTARYPCDDPTVEFIWQSSTLTMIEAVCPQSNPSTPLEAAGEVTPTLACVATSYNSTFSSGFDCFAEETSIPANFTSLEPTPSVAGYKSRVK